MMMDDNMDEFDTLLQPVAAKDAAARTNAQHAQRPAYSWLEQNGELIVSLMGAAVMGFCFAVVIIGLVAS